MVLKGTDVNDDDDEYAFFTVSQLDFQLNNGIERAMVSILSHDEPYHQLNNTSRKFGIRSRSVTIEYAKAEQVIEFESSSVDVPQMLFRWIEQLIAFGSQNC